MKFKIEKGMKQNYLLPIFSGDIEIVSDYGVAKKHSKYWKENYRKMR